MVAVYRRELQGYFYSPIAYIFIGVFLFLSGIFFFLGNIWSASADFNSLLGTLTFLFMIVVPVLTMRLMSEERKNKTDQLLLTSPISLTSMVVGKYFAALSVFLITLVISFIFPAILFIFGNPSMSEIVTGYIGFFCLGASLIAVGVFISALGENQITSAFITLGVLLVLYIMSSSLLAQLINIPWIVTFLEWFSVYERFSPFSQGVLGLTEVFYYLSFAAVFIFLTIRTVESRRWSEV
jgi:ABC-2 type transport system permease protein